ncbi:MAG TPA: SPFH domain-containing protein [Bacillota bacterium]|nr:SPFH domain-containing protein [Bacillota bacterium]HOK68130.1 SPFH domain-containing protein [Bacillota bacterium]HPP84432.1 SPFH domain-containing protein [Bacillota bacterium]
MSMIYAAVAAIVVVFILFSSLFIVQQQTIAIVERFGKFRRTAAAGLHIRAPFGIDRIVYRVPLRIQQNNIEIETKTKDNVFVRLNLAVQFQVDSKKVVEAYYKLAEPIAQIRSYVEDAIRSSLPKYTLDESYEKKDDIARDVFDTVSNEMFEYGYCIIKTLITSIEPAQEVKEAMNAINAAQRQRQAAQELANADKIKIVTAAEAEAEKDRLHGVGIANQRKAIVDGLSESFNELKSSGLSEKDIMCILLTEQYLDALNTFAKNGNQVIFLPAGPTGAEDIRAQLMSALAANKKIKN